MFDACLGPFESFNFREGLLKGRGRKLVFPVVLDHGRLGRVGVVLDMEEGGACFVRLFRLVGGLLVASICCNSLEVRK